MVVREILGALVLAAALAVALVVEAVWGYALAAVVAVVLVAVLATGGIGSADRRGNESGTPRRRDAATRRRSPRR